MEQILKVCDFFNDSVVPSGQARPPFTRGNDSLQLF